jgi:hypothetical protein
MILANADGNVQLYYDNALKLATTSTGIDVTGVITTDGMTTSADINFGDSDKAIFGAGSDLQIYHDGTNSYISDQGTNDLKVLATDFQLKNSADNEFMMTAVTDGAVTLYHNNAAKLATTATGIDVTGTVTADGLTVDGDSVTANAQNAMTLEFTSSTGVISADRTGGNYASLQLKTTDGSAPKLRQAIDFNGDISFYEDTGTTAKFFWDASAESLGIGTSSPSSYWSNADDLVVSTSGNTGISVVSGTTSTGYIIFADSTTPGDTTRGGLGYDHSTNNMLFRVNNDSKMTIDSSGRVGIGTSSPSDVLDVFGSILSSGTTQNRSLRLVNNSATNQTNVLASLYNNGAAYSDLQLSGLNLLFHSSASGTESMRIDSSGNLLVGTTTAIGAGSNTANNFTFSPASGYAWLSVSDSGGVFVQRQNDNSVFTFLRAAATVGSISVTASATAYNTSSDQRLKENITDAPAGNIDDIKVRSFDWKADGSHQDYGMVAQELEAVAPYAVTKGATEDDMWSVDYSKLVPMLIKEIQDLKAEVAALKGAN